MGCAVEQMLIFYLERIRRIDMPGIAHLVVKRLKKSLSFKNKLPANQIRPY